MLFKSFISYHNILILLEFLVNVKLFCKRSNIEFKQEKGFDCGTGQCDHFISYITMRRNRCIGLNFVFTIASPDVFDVSPPNFDPVEESKIFNKILSTFKFLK